MIMKAKLILIFFLLIILQACTEQQNVENEIYTLKNSTYGAVVCASLADVYDRPSIGAVRRTQLLYNQPVMIITTGDEFYEIQTFEGFLGFVQNVKLVLTDFSLKTDERDRKILITGSIKTVYSRPDGKIPKERVAAGTEFAYYGKTGDWVRVMMCDGEYGYLTLNDIILYQDDIPKTNVESFIRDILRFTGTKYLKGGASVIEGFDMENLIYTAAKINGVRMVPSIEAMQKMGKEVSQEEMQPGDVLFLSSDRYNNNIEMLAVLTDRDSVVLYSDSELSVIKAKIIDHDIRNRIRKVIRLF